MSFGWSVGDIVAGLKVVWEVYHSVSDGPLNAQYEASQFFDEYVHVFGRLEDWEKRKGAFAKDDLLARSHRRLRLQYTTFIKSHIALIQEANPKTKAKYPSHSTWIQKATFSREQVVTLYQKVRWPSERKAVAALRIKLQFFLELAAWDVGLDTNDIVRDIRASNADLMSSNLKLVTSHLELVTLVTVNLKRITNPLEPGHQTQEIDYPILRQFDHAIRPPRALPGAPPVRAIESAPDQSQLPWTRGSLDVNRPSERVVPPRALALRRLDADIEMDPLDQSEISGLVYERLDNLSKRMKRVDSLETIPESGSQDSVHATIQPLLARLRAMRDQIGEAVGILSHQVPSDGLSVVNSDPENALRQELAAWNQLEERIEREILHPPRHARLQLPPARPPSQPIDIPSRRRTSGSLSPMAAYDSWPGSMSSSPDRNRGSFSSSPGQAHSRSGSTSSVSRPQSIQLEPAPSADLIYGCHTIKITVNTISRHSNRVVQSIISTSREGNFRIYHTIDTTNSAAADTVLKPFLDDSHLFKGDEAHKWRAQFVGAHLLKIMNVAPNQNEKLMGTIQCAPSYKFYNEKDFLDFQSMVLDKDVKFCADVRRITSSDKQVQCLQGTIRVLLDRELDTRHILYFRHTTDQKEFVEWPVNLFKDPKEPKKTILQLDSADGRSLSLSRSLSRRSTQGSVATMASFETTPGAALERKGIRGLTVDFYDHNDCLQFWKEFRKKEVTFSGHGLGLTYGSPP